MLSRLIPILLLPGCTSSYDYTREAAHLVHQSVEAVTASSEVLYNRVKENAYQYPDRGTPLLRKANAIESRITELNTSLE
jgi:hypothetical protein